MGSECKYSGCFDESAWQGHREFDMLHDREYNKLPMHKNHELIADQNDKIRRYQLNKDIIKVVNIWMDNTLWHYGG